jgi:DNA-nicking Smr family endonuclease
MSGMGKKRKYKPRVLGPDEDLLKVFTRKTPAPRPSGEKPCDPPLNRHGLPVVDKGFSFAHSRTSDPSSFTGDIQDSKEAMEAGEDKAVKDSKEVRDTGDMETTPQAFTDLLESYLSRPSRKKRAVSPEPMPYHKRIKRYPPPEKELDLHGFTALGAQLKARSFLTACKHQGYFTVRIIVGRGLHSDPGPVLPDTIEDLLGQLKQQDIVLGFTWERKKKTRSGAVIVYLRQFSD